MNKIKNLGVPAMMVLILGVGCSQYDAPTETSIKVSSISYSELMANPNHIIIGGVMSDDNGEIESSHWVDTIDPKSLVFKKNLERGDWLFFGRMFIGSDEYCTYEQANLNQETQNIDLNFSRSQCSKNPLSSIGSKKADLFFCEDISGSKDNCLENAGDTKSFQFDFYKTTLDNSSPYFTSKCYQIEDGATSINAPFYFQAENDIALPGKIKMFKGVNCNGLSSEILFEYFLTENENIRSNNQAEALEFYIYDPTKNKKNIPSNKIAEVEVEIVKEETVEIQDVDEIVVDEEIIEEQESEVIEIQENEVIEEQEGLAADEDDISEPAIESIDSESTSETTEETKETTFTVEIDLLASELTITEISGKKGKGKQTVQYSHTFNMEVELFKVVINRINGNNDSSSKVSLPDLTSDHLFSFDENNQIEVFLGDYIQAGQTFVEFNVHVIGPKSNSEKINFEFYQLEN